MVPEYDHYGEYPRADHFTCIYSYKKQLISIDIFTSRPQALPHSAMLSNRYGEGVVFHAR